MMRKKFWVVGLAVICFMILQIPAFGQDIDDVNLAIRKSRANWQAGETSMTRMTPEEQMKRVGLIPPVLTGRESLMNLEAAAPQTAPPPRLDWRNNGGNFVTPIRNQGGCGSCWAFGATGALESAILIAEHKPGVDLDLAEQVLVSCDSKSQGCNGGAADAGARFFQE